MELKKLISDSISDYEQRVFIKFCASLEYSASVTHSNLVKVVGKNAYSEKSVQNILSRIRKGQVDVTDKRSGATKDAARREERLEAIQSAMDESRHWSTRALSAKLEIPRTTLKEYIKNRLKMKKTLGKWVPHELNEFQKETRVNTCRLNLRIFADDPDALNKTFSIDETWVSLYMSPNRNQQRRWTKAGEEPEPIVRENIHGNKRMLIMAMDISGIAFWELLPPKTSVNYSVYKSFLVSKIPTWINSKGVRRPYLLHDNARPHKHQEITTLLEKKGITVWPHPPYSPDISPLDFCCFGPLKDMLRGKKFSDWDEFNTALEDAVEQLNNRGQMKGIEKLPERWKEVIEKAGEYI